MRHRIVAAFCVGLWFLIAAPDDGLGQAAPAGTSKVTVTVDAAHPWIDSGLSVRKGERVSFEATGTIQWGQQSGQVAGPEGHDAKAGKLGKGGLIGRIGMTGKPFAIGTTKTPIVMPKNGELFLGINDFVFGDNSGAFSVAISRVAGP
jgi:PA-IL-like protein